MLARRPGPKAAVNVRPSSEITFTNASSLAWPASVSVATAPGWKPLPVTTTLPPDSQMRGVATPPTATPSIVGGAVIRTVTESVELQAAGTGFWTVTV